jgi:hypothetical protein
VSDRTTEQPPAAVTPVQPRPDSAFGTSHGIALADAGAMDDLGADSGPLGMIADLSWSTLVNPMNVTGFADPALSWNDSAWAAEIWTNEIPVNGNWGDERRSNEASGQRTWPSAPEPLADRSGVVTERSLLPPEPAEPPAERQQTDAASRVKSGQGDRPGPDRPSLLAASRDRDASQNESDDVVEAQSELPERQGSADATFDAAPQNDSTLAAAPRALGQVAGTPLPWASNAGADTESPVAPQISPGRTAEAGGTGSAQGQPPASFVATAPPADVAQDRASGGPAPVEQDAGSQSAEQAARGIPQHGAHALTPYQTASPLPPAPDLQSPATPSVHSSALESVKHAAESVTMPVAGHGAPSPDGLKVTPSPMPDFAAEAGGLDVRPTAPAEPFHAQPSAGRPTPGDTDMIMAAPAEPVRDPHQAEDGSSPANGRSIQLARGAKSVPPASGNSHETETRPVMPARDLPSLSAQHSASFHAAPRLPADGILEGSYRVDGAAGARSGDAVAIEPASVNTGRQDPVAGMRAQYDAGITRAVSPAPQISPGSDGGAFDRSRRWRGADQPTDPPSDDAVRTIARRQDGEPRDAAQPPSAVRHAVVEPDAAHETSPGHARIATSAPLARPPRAAAFDSAAPASLAPPRTMPANQVSTPVKPPERNVVDSVRARSPVRSSRQIGSSSLHPATTEPGQPPAEAPAGPSVQDHKLAASESVSAAALGPSRTLPPAAPDSSAAIEPDRSPALPPAALAMAASDSSAPGERLAATGLGPPHHAGPRAGTPAAILPSEASRRGPDLERPDKRRRDAEPPIRISIGRITIEAPPAARAQPFQRPRPTLSLSDYLERRRRLE